jgi:hypothetical protein
MKPFRAGVSDGAFYMLRMMIMFQGKVREKLHREEAVPTNQV